MKKLTWTLAVLATLASAAENSPAADSRRIDLIIYSSTDVAAFAPVLRDFHDTHPEIEVAYEEIEGAPLYERFLRETGGGVLRADMLLSSSMDLQVKLVNDGYAVAHVSANSRSLPAWARWRDEAFGFTFEPVVMVFNRHALEGRSLPRTRSELHQLLISEPAVWRDRVGTYDVIHNGIGYLLASQDERQSSDFELLMNDFGRLHVEVDESTGALLDHLESGHLAIGYNILASYAQARIDGGAPLAIVYPQDYTLAITRTALICRNAPHAAAAHLFLDYLLSVRGQQVLSSRGRLFAAREEIRGPFGRAGIAGIQVGPLRPIALGPGLLVYLDDQKSAALRARLTRLLQPQVP
jgi:iron(III) transport system substrate-binding protein